MKLYKPFPDALITQPFDQNKSPLYKEQGLVGHTGIDYGAMWGAPIRNAAPVAYCYAAKHREDPDPTQYRAVYTLVEDGEDTYEVSYGHCSSMSAEPGRTYYDGDIIAHVGNTGAVYAGGRAVSREARQKGSLAGSHLHFQVRAVKKVAKVKSGRKYLKDGNGILRKDGFYFEYKDADNGYNSCVDPKPFFTTETAEQAATRRQNLKKSVSLLSTLAALLTRKKG